MIDDFYYFNYKINHFILIPNILKFMDVKLIV